jgi:hypothetical protein
MPSRACNTCRPHDQRLARNRLKPISHSTPVTIPADRIPPGRDKTGHPAQPAARCHIDHFLDRTGN